MEEKPRAKKTPLYIAVVILALAAGAYLFATNVIMSGRLVSPDGRYSVYYNRLTKTITQRDRDSGTYALESECYDPSFLWSPNSAYLARNITGPDGAPRADIVNLAQSTVRNMPTVSGIQDMIYDMGTNPRMGASDPALEHVAITRWLGLHSVLIEFRWPSDTAGKDMYGWLIYNWDAWEVTHLSLNEIDSDMAWR